MPPIVECVPNFSEGRNSDTINAIGAAVRSVAGVTLLSVEPDKDYNRTVVTFVGSPDAVVEAAYQATRVAAEVIDMSQHKGEHPRLGATDVVPFVPVSGVSMQECVRLANQYGKRVAQDLGIPIYLYEEAATRPERRNLATIRKGEYEALAAKLQDPAWQPDYGASAFNARSGATVTGARMFLIAYNVNLSTNDPTVAHDIALHIRESGRAKKDEQGKPVVDEDGRRVMIPGSLKAVKAMGVLLEAHDIAQVSINLVNFHVTPPHVAFEEVKKLALQRGIRATGSEIVGLTPKEALLVAGRFYAPEVREEHASIGAAIEHLGLNQLDSFDVKKKIIEYQLEG
jgi:glutamate formiminotransferase / formiminotetrahydrofolate cyclodeaminase